MTQTSTLDNNIAVTIAGPGRFPATAEDAAASGAKAVISLVAIIKQKRAAAIKYGLLGTFSITATSATMWLVGLSMNYALNL